MKTDKKEKERALPVLKKIKIRTFYSILGICLMIVIGIGGKVYMDNKSFHDEMVNVVKSTQAKQIIEDELKGLDPRALTPEGKIKVYEINYKSIEHNLMGGIMFEIIINKDEELTLGLNIGKSSGKLKSGVVILSEKLSDDFDN
ncbi:hypothetical protein CI088_01690 [Enterococcus plantarum]|uniref:DUF1310 domain-containing protein n=1 Tax=Enterococcus plantarum TaxID=1077675 RepID=A0A2W3ZLI2_9ENTE|nr:DUF1310 family protein [Enterococcus plantarum]PZL77417.1 hypothetical protein CI088_01690 [Enterococcus plantarum]